MLETTKSRKKNKRDVTTFAGMEVVPVIGVLLAKAAWFDSGATTYKGILSQIEGGIAAGVSKFLLDFDTPGGEVAGNFALCRKITALKEAHNLKIYGIVNEVCCSGGYSLASCCDKVFAIAGSTVGSVGAVQTFIDLTKVDKKQKVGYTIFRSREDKALGSPHEGLTDKVAEKITVSLQNVDDQFTMLVLSNREALSSSVIDNLKGGTVTAEQGLKLGLVDKVIPYVDEKFFLEELETDSKVLQPKKRKVKMSDKDKGKGKKDKVKTPASVALEASPVMLEDVPPAVVEAIQKKAVITERERVSSITALGAELGLSPTVVARAIDKGQDLAQVKEVFGSIKEAMDEAEPIKTETLVDSDGSTKPQNKLAADLKKAKGVV